MRKVSLKIIQFINSNIHFMILEEIFSILNEQVKQILEYTYVEKKEYDNNKEEKYV